MEDNNKPAILEKKQDVSVFGNLQSFQDAQKLIRPLFESTMVPEAYQKNPANCMVAMEMSFRVGKSVLEIMQNMQIVKGNVGWKSEYVISEINRSGLFKEPLRFVFSEDRQSCYAVAVRKTNGEELRGTMVTMEMAAAEGWLNKNGSKWKTMPEQMLMYRSATFFCRVFCPEVLAGVQTSDEIVDIGQTEIIKNADTIEKFNDKLGENAEVTNFEEVENLEVTHEVVSQETDVDFETSEAEEEALEPQTPVVNLDDEDEDF